MFLCCSWLTGHFNPRSPCGERHRARVATPQHRAFQSTLPVRGATQFHDVPQVPRMISIHAPRAGSDNAANRMGCVDTDFNPRSPCGERPAQAGVIHRRFKDFNPRSPCGERPRPQAFRSRRRNFNPRSPCGERLAHTERDASGNEISIHAPRAGSDCRICLGVQLHCISIHAPRAGSDFSALWHKAPPCNFNPRSPCGERRCAHPG